MKKLYLPFFILILAAGLVFGQPQKMVLSGDLIIFHAGSLALPMKEIAAAFKKIHPEVNILIETAGSVECARKITDLKKPCDIMASSDYTVIDKLLIPKYAAWNIKFVSNELAIVYTEKSKYASQINQKNWFDILLKNDVAYGRSDPNSDPCGYRSVMTMQLAEKYYKQKGFTTRLLDKDRNYMRPKEVDMIALLESNAIDYIFLYKSLAVQHNLKYLSLPDEINLRDPSQSEFYKTANVSITGKEPGQKEIMTGEPMIYGVTMLNNAPNQTVAKAFLKFMLDADKGMRILEKHGQPSVIPQPNPNYDKIPAELKSFVKK